MRSEGVVVAVAGCKGGVGKTTTAINTGTVLATSGRAVLLVETDLAMANVVDFLKLGFDPTADPTLHDVLSGNASIESAIQTAPSGLRVLPSGTSIDGYVESDPSRLGGVIRSARDRFDVVVLDTPAGLSRETLLPISLADGVVLVSTPRVSAVRDVRKTSGIVERLDGTTIGLVLTHTGTGSAPSGGRIADFLGVDLLGSIPDDDAIPRSQDRGVAVVSDAPDSSPGRAYRRVADDVRSFVNEFRRSAAEPESDVETAAEGR